MASTVTDLLVRAMEEADTATSAIIVMTNQEGDILWMSTTDRLSEKVGLLETAKGFIISELKRTS